MRQRQTCYHLAINEFARNNTVDLAVAGLVLQLYYISMLAVTAVDIRRASGI